MRNQAYCHLILLFILVSFTTLNCSLHDEFSVVGDPNEFLSEERVSELFEDWKEEHKKLYKNEEEAKMRFQIFKSNLKYILERNSERKSPSEQALGLNIFADMSNEEFKEVYMSKIEEPLWEEAPSGSERRSLEETSCNAPPSLDWRKFGIVTDVKKQGRFGSCRAFSSTGAMEGINALATGNLISLSEQQLVDCVTSNRGCTGGFMDRAFKWVISNGGIATESGYPNTATVGKCNTSKEITKVSIDGYTLVKRDESALLCAVAKQPVSVGIDGSSRDFQLYKGRIFRGQCSNDPRRISHGVLIVGYGSEGGEDYWIVKNSWGTSWGIKGYVYIRRNTNLRYGVCAINAMASYPTKELSLALSPSLSPPPAVAPLPPPPSKECGDFFHCASHETCCCLLKLEEFCQVYGCCGYENAVCCPDSVYCCPSDYPICHIDDGLCLRNPGDIGVAAKKRKMAKYKFSSSKLEETNEDFQPLDWRMKQVASMA